MFVIIEGPNLTGKSTLARELSKRLHLPVVNSLRPKPSVFIEVVDLLTGEPPMIIDRLHLSEAVYGPMKRGVNRFDFRQCKIVELLCLMIGTVNIITDDDPFVIQARRHHERPERETFIRADEVPTEVVRFRQERDRSILSWWDYKIGDDVDELAVRIVAAFKKYQAVFPVRKFRDYRTLGTLNAEILFVGERYGGPPFLEPLVPFGNHQPGFKLFQAIEQLVIERRISWDNLMITNAYKGPMDNRPIEDDYRALADELRLPNVHRVIALGNDALEAVVKCNVAMRPGTVVRKVPHPSAAFSYQKMRVDDYAARIREAIQG